MIIKESLKILFHCSNMFGSRFVSFGFANWSCASIRFNVGSRGPDLFRLDTIRPFQLVGHNVCHTRNALKCSLPIQKGKTCPSTQHIFNGTCILTTRILDFGLEIWIIGTQKFVIRIQTTNLPGPTTIRPYQVLRSYLSQSVFLNQFLR